MVCWGAALYPFFARKAGKQAPHVSLAVRNLRMFDYRRVKAARFTGSFYASLQNWP